MTRIERFIIQRNMDGFSRDRARRNLNAMNAAICQQYDDWRKGREIVSVTPDRGIDNAIGYVRLTVVWDE